LLCNPFAGSGRAVQLAGEIASRLEKAGIPYTYHKNEWPENFDLFTDVFISGGDGTLNYFFNKYPGVSKPLVIFRGGTGNDVHSILYKNQSLDEQIQVALTAVPRPVDAGKCNERYFINGVGIGFEGAVSKTLIGKKKKPGKSSFMAAILKKIFFYNSKRYHVISDQYQGEGRHLLISIMNGHRAGGGFHIAPTSAIDDGLLDVIMVSKLHPLMRLWWLPVIEKGKHLGLSFVQHFNTKKITITTGKHMQAHLDGEYLEADRLEIEILPSKYLFRY